MDIPLNSKGFSDFSAGRWLMRRRQASAVAGDPLRISEDRELGVQDPIRGNQNSETGRTCRLFLGIGAKSCLICWMTFGSTLGYHPSPAPSPNTSRP